MKISGITVLLVTLLSCVYTAESQVVLTDTIISQDNKLTVDQTTFSIQIAASKKELPPGIFKKAPYFIEDSVDMKFRGGMFKYTVGKYFSFSEAVDHLRRLDFESFIVKIIKIPQPDQSGQEIITVDSVNQEILQHKIDSLELIRADSISTVNRYKKLIKEADSLFVSGEYEKAGLIYQDILRLYPSKTYSAEKIAEITGLQEKKGLKDWLNEIPLFLYIIGVFIATMLIVILVYILFRTRKNKIPIIAESIATNSRDTVMEYQFEDEEPMEFLDEEDVDNQQEKTSILDEVLQLYSNLFAEISFRIQKLDYNTDTVDESVKKIHSDKWLVKTQGYRELAKKEIKIVNEVIDNSINAQNNVLRLEAMLAFMRLNQKNPFGFLNNLKNPFGPWEQLHVYELAYRQKLKIPVFTNWFNSKNDSIISFCVKMIRAFKQVEVYEEVIPLLKHNNFEIRKESIITIGELWIEKLIPLLKEYYDIIDKHNQLVIYSVIGKRPEPDFNSVKEVFKSDNQLRIKLADVIVNLEEYKTRGIEKILADKKGDLQSIARNILDKRI